MIEFLKKAIIDQVLKIVSYNMHDLYQGFHFLKELSVVNDIILVQELWLTNRDFDKLSVSDDFIVFAASAMDITLSHGVLKGRPFGETGVLIRKRLAARAKLIGSDKRFIIVQIDHLLICCVYMPCSSVPCQLDLVNDTLASVSNMIDACTYTSIIIGGDFNLSFKEHNIFRDLIRNCGKILFTFD